MKRIPEDASDWTIPDDAAKDGKKGLPRRTVLLGAAWSVPVISASIATPLAAASTPELELTFVDGPYQAIACGPLDDIVVRATNGGAPAAGEPITVTLPTGLTWSDGTTAPRTLVSDTNGEVVLSGVLAGNANGNYALGATSGPASAASNAEVQGADRGVVSTFGGMFLPQLPAGVLVEDVQTNSTPQGPYAIVRGSDGNAYVSSLPTGSSTWSSWTKSTSPAAGSITDVAVSHQGSSNVVATTTQVGIFGPSPLSAPLPGGATILDVESYTTGTAANPVAVAVVLGSDGRAYSNSMVNGAWTGWTPTTLTGATNIAVGETGKGAVVAGTNRVAPVGGGAASPVMPNGATIEDVVTNVGANGNYTVSVLGSDGRVYSGTYNPTTNTWSSWGASTSALNGSVEHLSLSQSTGINGFLGSSNQVSLFNASGSTPPLPNGTTIVKMEGVTVGGVPQVAVLGSDGRAYVSTFQNNAWTPWRASRVGQGELEHVAVSETGNWTLVASNPLC
jgi:hypothetical protein